MMMHPGSTVTLATRAEILQDNRENVPRLLEHVATVPHSLRVRGVPEIARV